jgi:hypothetical protein
VLRHGDCFFDAESRTIPQHGQGMDMVLSSFAAASIWIAASIVPVAIDRTVPGPPVDASVSFSPTQKDAEIKPLVSSATDCIARTVSADPRLPLLEAPQVNDLIVASMPKCVNALRSMIDSYDTLYGEGAGEKFFMGPYLDGLPDAIAQRVRSHD